VPWKSHLQMVLDDLSTWRGDRYQYVSSNYPTNYIGIGLQRRLTANNGSEECAEGSPDMRIDR
jgi:hypothetical protein